MPEILGKLDPDTDAGMLLSLIDISELERAQVDLAVAGRIGQILAEARASESRTARGHFLVGLEDGRVVAAPYAVGLGTEKEG